MNFEIFNNAGLTVAVALATGIVAQAVARHIQIPGIVVLLGAGVVLGPDVLGMVRPAALGEALFTLVGFAVAVILFEGGMNLDLSRLRRAQRPIRRLVGWGVLVSGVGGTLVARFLLDWEWHISLLFGTLVIVTGPTVVNPLLRRLRVERRVSTVLEAEGVLVDPIGAVIAVVALELAISPSGPNIAQGSWFLLSRLAFGASVGLSVGLLLGALLRVRNLVPEGLENVFALALVLALYQVANALLHESGIMAVTVAGLVVGNLSSPALRDLRDFKEQLTVMLIGMLFVLLAADVRLAEIHALGWPGVAVVAVLLFLIRPAAVLAGTWGTELNWRDRAFMAWIGPRGIVAAAIASLFASELSRQGLPGGPELRALVFLVIGVTVLSAGLGGGLWARILRLQRPSEAGWMILGANDVALALARTLHAETHPVVCIDTNPIASASAEAEGIRVIHGNGLEERTLQRAEIDTRAGAIGLTGNVEVNLLFAQKARQEARQVRLLVTVGKIQADASRRLAKAEGAQVLFGRPVDLDHWSARLRHGRATLTSWRVGVDLDQAAMEELLYPEAGERYLAISWHRGLRAQPLLAGVALQKDDVLFVLLDTGHEAKTCAALAAVGLERIPEPPPSGTGYRSDTPRGSDLPASTA